MTLQTAFLIAGIALIVAGVAVGALAALTYVREDIRGVKDELSGAARSRSENVKGKEPAKANTKMKAFGQVGWRGKVKKSGEDTTGSSLGRADGSGSLGTGGWRRSVTDSGSGSLGVKSVSAELVSAGDEPTAQQSIGGAPYYDDEPTSVEIGEEVTTMLEQRKAAERKQRVAEGERALSQDRADDNAKFRITRKTIVLGSDEVLAE